LAMAYRDQIKALQETRVVSRLGLF
jgi:hypothetical protein